MTDVRGRRASPTSRLGIHPELSTRSPLAYRLDMDFVERQTISLCWWHFPASRLLPLSGQEVAVPLPPLPLEKHSSSAKCRSCLDPISALFSSSMLQRTKLQFLAYFAPKSFCLCQNHGWALLLKVFLEPSVTFVARIFFAWCPISRAQFSKYSGQNRHYSQLFRS